ncbi:hypothetical protein Vretimale_11156 [Volvox reticuliferus]|uniref:Uncharacterized protein n=1 Tax=Volvox reticuliferus TaxID=1737510 RepID=A0A8J4GFY9_9CHLO|nr:hypothetical protein Vretifemale_17095 [Volvox reticuliferus]GIM06912.1 hypothetical protein Vretimale_11156 [Volvox reticuliferus]
MTTSVLGGFATCKPQAHRRSHVLECGLRWHKDFVLNDATHDGGAKRQLVMVGPSPSAPLVTAAPWDHAVAVATGVSASSRVSRCRSAVAGGKDTLSMASSTPVPFPTQVASSTVASRPAVRFGVATGATAAARSAATAAASASPLGDTASMGHETTVADLGQLFPKGEYWVEMQVRDYELDQFNVVNNAVYSSFFQHGRHEAFAALGHDVDEYARRGTPLALSQLNITFRAPLRSRDVFRVTVSVQRVSGARVVFYQRILKCLRRPLGVVGGPAAGNGEKEEQGRIVDEELIAEAEAVVVFLDSYYRPARVPKDAARMFQALADLRKEQT